MLQRRAYRVPSSPYAGRGGRGGSPVSARSTNSRSASTVPSHNANDLASTGSVSPNTSACPPRERGAHIATARIHAVSVSTRASTPVSYRLVQASRIATARYSERPGVSPRTLGSAPGVAMTIIGVQAMSSTIPRGWFGLG